MRNARYEWKRRTEGKVMSRIENEAFRLGGFMFRWQFFLF